MIEGAEAVHLPENVESEPGHNDSADDRGNATEGIPVSTPAEDKKDGRTGDHFRQSGERSSKEFLAKQKPQRESNQTESRCRDRKETFSEFKDSKDISRWKD